MLLEMAILILREFITLIYIYDFNLMIKEGHMKNLATSVCLLFVFAVGAMATPAAAFELFDGRLHEGKGDIMSSVNIRTHRDARDVQFSSFRTQAHIEGLYDLIRDHEAISVQVYGLFTYWYDWALHVDGGLKRAVRLESGGSHGLEEFRQSNEEEEIIKELYFDVMIGSSWQIRLGKQLVSWGETAEARVADVINPLDYSNLTAFPDWEDYKIGLWMARIFLTPPNMWQDLSFEFLLIPGFEYDRMPAAGSGAYLGTPQGASFGTYYWPDYMGRMLHERRANTPANTWKNFELGMRLRGLSWGTDWTASVFYTRADSPIVDGTKGFNNLQTIINNKVNGVNNPYGNVYDYPRYTSVAFTFSRPVDVLKSTLRGELVGNIDRDYNYGAFRRKQCNLWTAALSWDRNNFVPFISEWNRNRAISSTLTYYHYKLVGYHHDRLTGEYIRWENGRNDDTWDKITLTLSTGIYYDTILPAINILYDFHGNTTFLGQLKFAPGDHWRLTLIYQQVNEAGRVGHLSDQVICQIKYCF